MDEIVFDVEILDLYEGPEYFDKVTDIKYTDGVLEFTDNKGKWNIICTSKWRAVEVTD